MTQALSMFIVSLLLLVGVVALMALHLWLLWVLSIAAPAAVLNIHLASPQFTWRQTLRYTLRVFGSMSILPLRLLIPRR